MLSTPGVQALVYVYLELVVCCYEAGGKALGTGIKLGTGINGSIMPVPKYAHLSAASRASSAACVACRRQATLSLSQPLSAFRSPSQPYSAVRSLTQAFSALLSLTQLHH